jgi:arylsulfatase A-like enzyme
MVLNVDIAPTILDLAGIAIPPSMQGRSLWPLINNEAVSGWRRDFYYRYYDRGPNANVARHFGIRTKAGMKLINYRELGEWELFDLTQDPFELRSVYDDPSYATQRATLTKRLAALQTQLGDTP